MKTLYVGPYRHNNVFGTCARHICDLISESAEIEFYTKNILLNNVYHNKTMINYSRGNKPSLPDKFDITIQHCPIEMLHIDKEISSKNIAIPIMDFGISHNIKTILDNFDIICVDNEHHFKILQDIGIKPVLLNYNIREYSDKNKKINIGFNTYRTTIYFIGSYEENINIINKLIVSFILSFRDNQDVCLVIVLNDENKESVANSINKIITESYKKLNYNSTISPIQIIIQSLTPDDLNVIHNTFDIFIDLNDEYCTGLNHNIAEANNKHIISINDLENISVPYLDGYVYDTRYKYSSLTTSLIKKLKDKVIDIQNNVLPNTKTSKNILEIIHDIT